MRQQDDSVDAAVARIAARQYGVASIAQMRDAGLSDSAVARRTRAGRLHRVHRGVYAVGHRGLAPEGFWMAAVLAIPGAVLSHRSSAALWGLLPWRSEVVEVSVRRQSGRCHRDGVHVHRCASLRPEDLTSRRRIPVTTPARTIADLRAAVPANLHRRAIRQAEVLGLATGVAVPTPPTRSELEDRFLDLCRRFGLPQPAVNVPVGGMTVDFLWRDALFVVETDGYRYHRGHVSFEDDHDRDLRLRAMGYDVTRLTFRQVTRRPRVVAAILERELRGRGSSR